MKIFFDVDTQNDFMSSRGKLYVPGSEKILTNLLDLTRFGTAWNIPIMGSVDRHFGTSEYKDREEELTKWGGDFPDHCMDETYGQRKILDTLIITPRLERMKIPGIYIPHRLDSKVISEEDLTRTREEIKNIEKGELLNKPEGIYFEKQSYDVFTNPATEFVLKDTSVKEAVVYGIATDYCIKAAVLGMQSRGIQCYVVKDAINGIEKKTIKQAIKQMKKAGAKFIKTKDVMGCRIV